MRNKIKRRIVLGIIMILMVLFSVDRIFAATEDNKLLSSDGAAGDNFGRSVSVNDDVMVVGAIGCDEVGEESGGAYVYRLDGVNWVEEAKLVASDGMAGDHFGWSVAVDRDVIVVGAPRGEQILGKVSWAYVFRYDGVNWVEEAKLIPGDGATGSHFGYSVSVKDDVIVVGAYDDDSLSENRGSAYVYRYNGGDWIEEDKIVADDGTTGDFFGRSVSDNKNVVIIGAPGDDDAGSESGSVYIFQYDGVNWIEEGKFIANDGMESDHFGHSVSVNKNVIVVGASGIFSNSGVYLGSAYVFRYDGTNWIEEAKLTASDGVENDAFSYSVSLDRDTILIGAYGNDDAGNGSGSAYVYRFNGVDWLEVDKLVANDAVADAEFGFSVSLSANLIAVGAPGDDDAGRHTGSVYIFGKPCSEPKVVNGFVKDRKSSQKDEFSIKLKKLTGLSNSLVDLNTKIVHVKIGPLSLNIPGDEFVALRHGTIRYFGHPAGTKGIFQISFHKDDSAILKGFKTNLNGISNPISAVIEIDDGGCWQSTTRWRKFWNHGTVIYHRL